MTVGYQRNNAPDTRGRPFAPGNPGKPKGARNRATRLLEAILLNDANDVAEAVVKAAKNGDIQAAKMILDRASPVPRGRRVHLNLPVIETAADVLAGYTAVIAAMAAGEVSPGEAAAIAGILEAKRRAIETVEIERRLMALEGNGDPK